MASRNRGRQAVVKTDADEERAIWSQLRSDAKRVDSYIAEHNQKWLRIIEIKEILETQHANGEDTSSTLENELAKLSRENIKLCEDITTSLKASDDNSILSSLDILKALRQSSESEISSSIAAAAAAAAAATPPPRAAAAAAAAATANPKSMRGKNRKGDASSVLSADDREGLGVVDGAMAPSPKVVLATSTRLKAAGSRAGSVGVGREASVKVEDGIESGADIAKIDKSRYTKGTEVFYRTKKGTSRSTDKDDQGEGILCTITNITGEGKHRKYEIIDVEPDEGATPYRANLSQMVGIPAANDGLPEPLLRKTVLAMYPGTTTFYRAEVVAVRGKDVPVGNVKLKFEDEDDKNMEMNVERRYVLLQ